MVDLSIPMDIKMTQGVLTILSEIAKQHLRSNQFAVDAFGETPLRLKSFSDAYN